MAQHQSSGLDDTSFIAQVIYKSTLALREQNFEHFSGQGFFSSVSVIIWLFLSSSVINTGPMRNVPGIEFQCGNKGLDAIRLG